MAKTKNVYIRCPRCELNYIKKSDEYCDVCKKEMKLIKSDELDDLELCPICRVNFIQEGQEICDTCRQEYGITTEGGSDSDINDWHRYIADDDVEDEDDEMLDDMSEESESGVTAGLDDEDLEFANELEKDMDLAGMDLGEDDDDDSDDDYDDFDDDYDSDDDYDDDDDFDDSFDDDDDDL